MAVSALSNVFSWRGGGGGGCLYKQCKRHFLRIVRPPLPSCGHGQKRMPRHSCQYERQTISFSVDWLLQNLCYRLAAAVDVIWAAVSYSEPPPVDSQTASSTLS